MGNNSTWTISEKRAGREMVLATVDLNQADSTKFFSEIVNLISYYGEKELSTIDFRDTEGSIIYLKLIENTVKFLRDMAGKDANAAIRALLSVHTASMVNAAQNLGYTMTSKKQ